jgi:hypothetical protein
MKLTSQPELVQFLKFFQELVAEGRTDLSIEQALELWREPCQCPDDPDSTLAALREGIADMEAGEQGIPIEKFNRELGEQRSRRASATRSAS